MKNYIKFICFSIACLYQINANGQQDCGYGNSASAPVGTYQGKVKIKIPPTNSQAQFGKCVGDQLFPDSFVNHKLSISLGNDTGEFKGLSKDMNSNTLIDAGENIYFGNYPADNPYKYIHVSAYKDQFSKQTNYYYIFNYYSKSGSFNDTVNMIPDSTMNYRSDDNFNFTRLVNNPAYSPGGPPVGLPPNIKGFMNDTSLTGYLKRNYKCSTCTAQDICQISIEFSPWIENLGTYNADQDFLPTSDKIILKAPTGFPRGAYRWQYRYINTKDSLSSWGNHYWTDFPDSVNYNETVRVCARDIMGDTCYNNLNKTIYIRIKTGEGGSDLVVKNIRLSSPKIDSIKPVLTRCTNSSDGKVILYFNRKATFANEQAFILIQKAGSSYTQFKDSIDSSTNKVYISPEVLPEGDYVLQVYGTLNQNGIKTPTYNPCQYYFSISRASKVSFTSEPTHIACIGNPTGRIKIEPQGGTSKFEYNIQTLHNTDSIWHPGQFSYDTIYTSFDTVLSKGYIKINLLYSNTFLIKVRDTNSCVARNANGFGSIYIDTVIVKQPSDSIRIIIDSLVKPTAYGFGNGRLKIRIKGGTADPVTGKYIHHWENAHGDTLHLSEIDTVINGQYFINIAHLSSSIYIMKVKDNHYNTTSAASCSIISYINITQPDSIHIAFDNQIPSCNHLNEEPELTENGILVAHVMGGVPLTNGQKYLYHWEQFIDSSWVTLSQQDSILFNIGAGIFRVNVTDANGIKHALYLSDTLNTLLPVQVAVGEPDSLVFNETINAATCVNYANGNITLAASGGTAPYTYIWDNAIIDSSIANVASGFYEATITDINGCNATKALYLEAQNIYITSTITPPNCHNGSDGVISVSIFNPNSSSTYYYSWLSPLSGGDSTKSGLSFGEYFVDIEEWGPLGGNSNCQGCGNVKLCNARYRFYVKNPNLIPLNLPPNNYICTNQTLKLRIDKFKDLHPNYGYNWTNNSNNSTLSDSLALFAGYSDIGSSCVINATVTDPNRGGCVVGTQDFNVYIVNADIEANFLLPTHAYPNEEIKLVDVSRYTVDSTRWSFPSHFKYIKDESLCKYFQIDHVGTYPITIKKYLGSCIDSASKSIVIDTANASGKSFGYEPFIINVTVSPSPVSHGNNFVVHIDLKEAANVNIKLYYVLGYSYLGNQSATNITSHDFTFPTSSLAAGIYMLVIETAQERKLIKVIIQ